MSQLNVYQPHWVREDFVDFIGEKFDPMWSMKKVKAKIVAKQNLSQDFVQIELRPNRNFNTKAYQAGQSVMISVRMNGVFEQRHYSIVQILEHGDIVLAVKQQGKVSFGFSQLSLGSIVEISQPQGDFVLHDVVNPVLLLASGSGITSIYALLKQALKLQTSKIDLVYFTRDDAYHADFKSLALTYPHFYYHHINTLEQKQHLDEALLSNLVPHYQFSDTYACGASGMMLAVRSLYEQLNISDRLNTEYFQLNVDETVAAQPIKFLRSQQDFQATQNILSSAEQAGLKPKHGCRMGVCNTCSCTKVSGSVKNLLTGEIDHRNNSQIKLCISQAISPVEINL